MIEILGYVGLALIPAFILLDAFRGHRKYTEQRWWRLRGAAEDRSQKALQRQIVRQCRLIERRLLLLCWGLFFHICTLAWRAAGEQPACTARPADLGHRNG